MAPTKYRHSSDKNISSTKSTKLKTHHRIKKDGFFKADDLEELLKVNPEILNLFVVSLRRNYEKDEKHLKREYRDEINKLKLNIKTLGDQHPQRIKQVIKEFEDEVDKLKNEVQTLRLLYKGNNFNPLPWQA